MLRTAGVWAIWEPPWKRSRGHDIQLVRDFVWTWGGASTPRRPQVSELWTPWQRAENEARLTLAIEPMVNMGGSGVRFLDDKWTGGDARWKPSAHFEHTVSSPRAT